MKGRLRTGPRRVGKGRFRTGPTRAEKVAMYRNISMRVQMQFSKFGLIQFKLSSYACVQSGSDSGRDLDLRMRNMQCALLCLFGPTSKVILRR